MDNMSLSEVILALVCLALALGIYSRSKYDGYVILAVTALAIVLSALSIPPYGFACIYGVILADLVAFAFWDSANRGWQNRVQFFFAKHIPFIFIMTNGGYNPSFNDYWFQVEVFQNVGNERALKAMERRRERRAEKCTRSRRSSQN